MTLFDKDKHVYEFTDYITSDIIYNKIFISENTDKVRNTRWQLMQV